MSRVLRKFPGRERKMLRPFVGGIVSKLVVFGRGEFARHFRWLWRVFGEWHDEQRSGEIAPAGLDGMEAFRIWVGQEFEHCLLIGRKVLSGCDDRIFGDCEAFNRALLAKILGVAIAVENVDEVVLLSGRRRDTDIAVKKAW